MRWLFYLLVFGLIISPAVAEKVTVTSDVEWVTANTIDTAIITAKVTTDLGSPINNTNVVFSIVNTSPSGRAYGSLNGSPYPITVQTDNNGIATAIFKVFTVSGTANISANIDGNVSNYTYLNIDHNIPYSLQYLTFPDNATVGTARNIKIRLQDIHGNFIDNLNNTEYINLTRITQDPSLFWNTTSLNFTDVKTTLGNDQEGFFTANISLYTEPGDTRVRIIYPNVIDQTIRIERVADGEPYYIYAVRFDPSVPFLPANGKEYFVVTYQLFDQYNNVLNNKIINLNVSPGGDPWRPNTTTTYNGLAAVKYGPSNRTFQTNLIATARDNTSVQSSLPVEFYDPSPVKLLLSINPRNIPSLDVNETSKAIITAVVIDDHGRGVEGQTVTFTNPTTTYSPLNAKWVEPPSISSNSLTTGESGFGYITFSPGRFDNDELRSVTGESTITGTWNGTSKTVIPLWKNYGYLKVTTWVSDNNITENQMVDVGVEVYADGPEFTSRPIDMIFCTDRGASMLWDTYDHQKVGSDDKMRYLYNYSGVILEELIQCNPDEKCDRAGVVSFGPGNSSHNWPEKWPGDDTTINDDDPYRNLTYPKPYPNYTDYTTINTGLEYTFKALVQNEIESLRPFSDPFKANKHNVPLRYGLYKSINELIGLGTTLEIRPQAIRAIVVLSDPEWNDWGDPSAGWDGTRVKTENAETRKAPYDLPQGGLSAWVPFYQFGVVNKTTGLVDPKTALVDDPLQNMANYASEHDIIIYSIAYPKKDANIEESRERVFRGLADSTGGMYFECRNGTQLETIFETIGKDLRQRASVNTTAVFNFTNVKLNGSFVSGVETFDYVNNSESTRTRKWNSTPNNTENLLYDLHRNDTQNWTVNQRLTFDLGTMYIHDRWLVNFTLMSKKVGTAELFEDSYITSDEDVISVPQPIVQTGAIRFGDVPTSSLEITYFNVSDALHAGYTIKYSGSDVVHAKLYYQKSGLVTGNWKQFAARNYNQCNENCVVNPIQDEAMVSKWVLGSDTYMFKIEAWANDAPLDIEYDGPIDFTRTFFIWLR